VNALRYSLLLPLIHLAMSAPIVYYDEALIWRQIPRIQAQEDFERVAPPLAVHSGPIIEWRPCYEYRDSHADRFLFAVEFPAGILIPPHGASGCNPTLLQSIWQKVKNWMRVKLRVVLLDCFLIFGIAGQWWMVGHWLERLCKQRKGLMRWIIPVVVNTISGIVVAAETLGDWRSVELGAIMISMVALLAWLALLLMFAVAAVRWAIRTIRQPRHEHS
jgi:hypothetical protein